MTKTELLNEVDEIIAPEKMSPEEAIEFLEQLGDEIEMRIQGIKDDMRHNER